MKSKKGITLVSLVVTIIVLIILAGVSINLTLGENGIITIAKQARENMELAKIEEENHLNELYSQIILEGENTGEIDYNSISKLIEFKQKVASAITDMGVETLETANADTMASNIRSISTNKDAASISYDNTSSELTSTNVQSAVDELDSQIDGLNESLNKINSIDLATANIEWDYDNKVDIVSHNTVDNYYTLPSNGIIYFNGTGYFGVVDVNLNMSVYGLYVPDQSYRQANFLGFKGQKIYFNNCSIAYFIPFKQSN